MDVIWVNYLFKKAFMKSLVVIGNSVTIRVKPESNTPTYSQLIADHFETELIHLGKGAMLLSEFIKGKTINAIPLNSHVIINFGIVDMCSRAIPKSLYDFMMNQDAKLFQKTRKLIRFFENKFRTKLVNLFGQRPWTSIKIYQKEFSTLIKSLEEKNCTFSILEINIPNNRIEKNLPGSKKRVIELNNVLKKDYPIISTKELDHVQHYPDGIHYNTHGHEVIANKIITSI